MSKNIVLLSDGTGNSAAKLFKTNVWRLYEALDNSDPTRQVACYDDGVGTSGFLPLKLLGGALGVGLKHNVLRLYRFLCEHYEPGDRIYAFGFSRGAFTIRVLIGLIENQGVIFAGPGAPSGEVPVHGGELARLSRQAYRAFRWKFNQTGGLVSLARRLRDAVLWLVDTLRGRRRLQQAPVVKVPAIEFIGVWDTVDAYGLPLDEMTDGIDQWVWPLSMPDLRLLPFVKKACHALALDDERNTFQPVLWDESEEPALAIKEKRVWPPTTIDEERLSQVWFAGVHSNVGGGYANDVLAYVSLEWMACEAAKRKLIFVRRLIANAVAKRDPLGRLEDSRRGFSGYYRYNPRKIEWLTNGQVHEQFFTMPSLRNGRIVWKPWPMPTASVTIGRPKIHESVFTRIAAAPEAYAPIVLPKDYAVAMSDGRILAGPSNPFETEKGSAARAAAQEKAWDFVWMRRVVYFSAVFVSLFVLSRPLGGGAAEAIATHDRGFLSTVVATLGGLLPSMAAPWIEYYTARPWELLIGLGVVFALAWTARRLKGRICDAMRRIWMATLVSPSAVRPLPPPHDSRIYRMRRRPVYQGLYAVLRRKLLPTVFGLAALVWLAALANRAAFELFNGLGVVCKSSGLPLEPLQAGDDPTKRDFDSREFCLSTAIWMDAGARYLLTIEPPKGGWRDQSIPVASAQGFSSFSPQLGYLQRAVFVVFAPSRRVWRANWFVPIARIGPDGFDEYRVERGSRTLTARTSGELFLFMNDAIWPVKLERSWWPLRFGWPVYYRNNEGTATVTIRKIAPPLWPVFW